jgi:hypothetical protein
MSTHVFILTSYLIKMLIVKNRVSEALTQCCSSIIHAFSHHNWELNFRNMYVQCDDNLWENVVRASSAAYTYCRQISVSSDNGL